MDWTVNTNHTGFYLAQQKGFYGAQGIDLELLTPDQDNFLVTPAKKVELGNVNFALCPLKVSLVTGPRTNLLKPWHWRHYLRRILVRLPPCPIGISRVHEIWMDWYMRHTMHVMKMGLLSK